jgi:hypothetical protein
MDDFPRYPVGDMHYLQQGRPHKLQQLDLEQEEVYGDLNSPKMGYRVILPELRLAN